MDFERWPTAGGSMGGVTSPTGLEPVALRSATLRSIQLSYGDFSGETGRRNALYFTMKRRSRQGPFQSPSPAWASTASLTAWTFR